MKPTLTDRAARIRQLKFELEKADLGMGMPRDYQRVVELRKLLAEAIEEGRVAALAAEVQS